MSTFESPYTPAQVSLDMTVEVLDPNGIHPPHTIIQVEDAWQIKVEWEFDGNAWRSLGGNWLLSVYAESIGEGPEKALADNVSVPFNGTGEYEETVDVPAFDPVTLAGLPVGAYRLVTLLTAENFGVRQEMAAFMEGPIIQIYEEDIP